MIPRIISCTTTMSGHNTGRNTYQGRRTSTVPVVADAWLRWWITLSLSLVVGHSMMHATISPLLTYATTGRTEERGMARSNHTSTPSMEGYQSGEHTYQCSYSISQVGHTDPSRTLPPGEGRFFGFERKSLYPRASHVTKNVTFGETFNLN